MDLPDLGADMPPLGEVIGTRELQLTRHTGQRETTRLSVGAPVLRGGTWWCPYEIRSPSFSHTYALAGEDSLQALLGSVCILSTELEALAREHQGTFSHFGSQDLMLPSMGWLRREGDAGEG
jgi:hypothetical protein